MDDMLPWVPDLRHGCLDAEVPDNPEEVVANVPDSTIKPGVEIV
jgi:hypothetical protein